MTDMNLVADVQRAEVLGRLTEGAHVAPSVTFLADGILGSFTLSVDANCSLAAVALPMRVCPEITMASLAFDGTLANLSTRANTTPAFTVMQFHRDQTWAIEIQPYILSDGMLVWDVESRRFDDLDPPEPMRDLTNHLYQHLAETDVYGRGDRGEVRDRFRVAGEILTVLGDVTEIRITKEE